MFEEEFTSGEGTCISGVGCLEPATFNDGYLDDLGAAFKLFSPSCPGQTTETLINGPGEPYTDLACANGPGEQPFPFVWLHYPYTPSANGSPLSDALVILKANPNVSAITLDIWSNDLADYLARIVLLGR